MANFITSIKLESATDKDYQLLTEYLEREFFVPEKIVYSNLPTRTFSYSKKINLFDVTAIVSKVAAKTGKKYSFTILRDKIKPE